MFRRSIAVVAMAGTALLAASDVRAQTTAELLIERFDSLCVDTLADRAAVRDAADAMGWMPTPAGFLPPDETIKNMELWMLNSREGAFLGFFGDVEFAHDGKVAPMSVCAVAVERRPAGLAEALDRYTGGVRLAGFSDTANDAGYGFLIVDGKAQPAPAMSDEATMDAILNGEQHIVMTQDESGKGIVMYMAPRR